MTMKAGFAKADITPEVGVELAGFGPYLKRRSTGIRDRLWAKAMALEAGGGRVVIVGCDLIGVPTAATARVRLLVTAATGLPGDALMICCSHTHSGPNPTADQLFGWGEPDPFYVETLPHKIARAAIAALERLEEAELAHANPPCEGIGLNREYDRDAPPLDEVLRDNWRPAKPELTDTRCHVLTARTPAGRLLGFAAYFGCHPVVCCAETHAIHGDFVGVAMNLLERENPGAVGLFIQGAQGDVNSCVVHKPEPESLLALDVIAARFANAVRAGLAAAQPVVVEAVTHLRRDLAFSLRQSPLADLKAQLKTKEAFLREQVLDQAAAATHDQRFELVVITALRQLIAVREAGGGAARPAEVQGLRFGPVEILASGFELFQAIKNEVVAQTRGPITLVAGVSNEIHGYAVDRRKAREGGYAAQIVPLLAAGTEPYRDIQGELTTALTTLSRDLADAR